jgi:hypothetical protein
MSAAANQRTPALRHAVTPASPRTDDSAAGMRAASHERGRVLRDPMPSAQELRARLHAAAYAGGSA